MGFVTPELLSLYQTPGIGPQRMRNLVARFKTPAAVYSASTRQLCEVGGIDQTLAAAIKKHRDLAFAEKQICLAGQSGVTLLSIWDEDYPPLLQPLFDPPLILFVQGDIKALSLQSVAMVGTRAPSEYAQIMAEKFARELVQRGLAVISGLARGVDTLAHHACVSQGGVTVAVLGSGLDQIYPSENKQLARRIAERGAVISEYPFGAKPDAPHFPRRNRIIAGLSLATLVVEAGETSGALITADNALEYGREVMAIPGNVNNPKSWGCNRLIQQGAKLVQNIDDILVEIGLQMHPARAVQLSLPVEDLSDEESAVLQVLGPDPVHIDAISLNVQQPVSQTAAILLQLELKNLVIQLPGKKFARA